jgi:uncharacterized membrane protein YkvA (DUF1232 family)
LKRFDLLLEEDISGYQGELSDLISQAPALYRLMTRLLDNPALPRNLSPLVIAAIAYFIAPADIIPEESVGPKGYVDDIFLCAYVAENVMRESGSESILVRDWDGRVPVVPLVREILNRERELIGDKKEQILQYIGYEQLGGLARSDEVD